MHWKTIDIIAELGVHASCRFFAADLVDTPLPSRAPKVYAFVMGPQEWVAKASEGSDRVRVNHPFHRRTAIFYSTLHWSFPVNGLVFIFRGEWVRYVSPLCPSFHRVNNKI